ncbi:hypothetical protein CPSG_05102 [Coccidioides posadasii str. Silveira]|uniref:Uncharacterized protein n=1 Tax=Coccidioides posadasii (strain RMSCC 757 / Silveira) TaxID=443226 RepID=E9D672_COCPS|nr:hypothetical protein CPSG_05102 [Coccidioides posadasii str. Silveira]
MLLKDRCIAATDACTVCAYLRCTTNGFRGASEHSRSRDLVALNRVLERLSTFSHILRYSVFVAITPDIKDSSAWALLLFSLHTIFCYSRRCCSSGATKEVTKLQVP